MLNRKQSNVLLFAGGSIAVVAVLVVLMASALNNDDDFNRFIIWALVVSGSGTVLMLGVMAVATIANKIEQTNAWKRLKANRQYGRWKRLKPSK